MADRFRVLLKSVNPATGQVVGEPRLLYDPEPKQRQLHASRARNVLYGGAAGGGKSHGLRWHLVLMCLRRKQMRVLLLRRQFTDLEKTHLLDLPTEVPSEIARYDQSKHRLMFRSNGSVLQFGHCDNEKDFSGYLSTEWDAIGIDEAGQFDPRWLVKLSSRCRTTKRDVTPQMVYATNPGGPAHVWLKQHFITQTVTKDEDPEYDPADYLFIQALVSDNPHLDEEYVRRLRSLPTAEREAFLYGNWDAFAGQFFAEWRHALHTVPPFEVPDWWEREGGMDWGFYPNPGVLYWSAFDEHGRGWLYRELVFRQKTPGEVAQMIYDRSTSDAERRMTFRGDPSMWIRQPQTGVSIAAAINDRLAELGSEISIVQANNDRLNGWVRLRDWLNPRRRSPETGQPDSFLHVFRPDREGTVGCPYLIETLPAQVYDERPDHVGDLKKNATDHGCDGARYLFMARPPLSTAPEGLRPAVAHHTVVHRQTARVLERIRRRQRSEETGDESLGPAVVDEDDEGLESQVEIIADIWQ